MGWSLDYLIDWITIFFFEKRRFETNYLESTSLDILVKKMNMFPLLQ